MVGVEQWAEIRRMYFVKRLSIKEIVHEALRGQGVETREGQRMQDEVNRLLGLEGIHVRTRSGGVLEVEVELTVAAAVCPHCGRASIEVKERLLVLVRDLSISGRWTWLRGRKPLRLSGLPTDVHRDSPGDSTPATHDAGVPAPPVRARARHRRARRDRSQRRDDSLPGRPRLPGRSALERYLHSLPDEQRQAIEVVSIDPYEPYRRAIQTVLPDAVIVCDPFHLVRGVNTALDTVRRERQRLARSKRGKGARRAGRTIWKRELYRVRHTLLKARERLSARERRRLCELFHQEPLIAEAWALKEAFRAIYHARDRRQADQRLERFLTGCRLAAIPSCDAFADGIRLWRQELLAYFDQPVTNGYAEGVINKIKVIKRRAYGLPTFEGFRRRILVACS